MQRRNRSLSNEEKNVHGHQNSDRALVCPNSLEEQPLECENSLICVNQFEDQPLEGVNPLEDQPEPTELIEWNQGTNGNIYPKPMRCRVQPSHTRLLASSELAFLPPAKTSKGHKKPSAKLCGSPLKDDVTLGSNSAHTYSYSYNSYPDELQVPNMVPHLLEYHEGHSMKQPLQTTRNSPIDCVEDEDTSIGKINSGIGNAETYNSEPHSSSPKTYTDFMDAEDNASTIGETNHGKGNHGTQTSEPVMDLSISDTHRADNPLPAELGCRLEEAQVTLQRIATLIYPHLQQGTSFLSDRQAARITNLINEISILIERMPEMIGEAVESALQSSISELLQEGRPGTESKVTDTDKRCAPSYFVSISNVSNNIMLTSKAF